MEWIATCPHETVDTLALELKEIGIVTENRLYRGIRFDCDLETAYKAHLSLRSASRIQLIVSEFEANNFNSLKLQLSKINWQRSIRSHRPYTVFTTITDDSLNGLDNDKVIEMVVASIKASPFEKQPPEFNPKAKKPIGIVIFVRDSKFVIGVDTAGKALHKRGWRTNGHPAVLKETLAASILMLAGYDGKQALMDPMCGSGTLIIEGAYIALDKAPLIHRSKDEFTLEHLAGFDRKLWRKVSDQLRSNRKLELDAPIFASDINPKFIEVARAASLKARVEKYIHFDSAAFQEVQAPCESGLLVMNLPYGERIGVGTINRLYKEVGQAIKKNFSKWKVALLLPTRAPSHLLEFKHTRKYILKNGAIDVKLLIKEPPK